MTFSIPKIKNQIQNSKNVTLRAVEGQILIIKFQIQNSNSNSKIKFKNQIQKSNSKIKFKNQIQKSNS
ncbi:MAG: hypothetical protein EAZ58_08520, partial [Flavobacterium sp.]